MRGGALVLFALMTFGGVAAYASLDTGGRRSYTLSEVVGEPSGPGGVLLVDDATLDRLPAPAREAFHEALREGHAWFELTRGEARDTRRALDEAAAAQGLGSVGFYALDGRVFRMGELVA